MTGPAAGPARTFSVRALLLLLVIGTLLPTLLVAAFLVRRVVADNRTSVERQLLEAAHAEAALVDAEIGGTMRALQGLGQSDRLTESELPLFYDQARRLLSMQPTWAAVTLATADGRQLFNTSVPFGQPLPTVGDRDSFDRTLTTKRPAIGNLRIGQLTKELGFPVRVPVVLDDGVTYVITAWITSRSFADVLRRQTSVTDEWVRGIVDPGGVIVARSRDPERYIGQNATAGFLQQSAAAEQAVYKDLALDGTSVYGAFSRAPMSRWIAGVAVEASIVDAPFRQSMIALLAIAVALIGLGGGGAFLISRRITYDISKSVVEAEALAGGRHPSPVASRVTELQRLLDALARSGALLERRQRERDDQVARAAAARAEAEAADRSKDQFLAMLGHELRNPLAPALTALHLMKLRGIGAAAREREILERQIRHMARLVDDLLDVSRLQRGAIELRRERFDLGEAVAQAVEMTGPTFAEKRHQLEVDVPSGIVIDADRSRIAQVLSNLLTNAAKYTEPRGHVVLRARKDNGDVIVECRDNGIGMTPDLVPRVFDLFVQGQRGLDRRQGGLGLGLAVARTLVELHGGRIEARSEGTNQGSTFTARLPLSAKGVASKVADDCPAPPPQARIGRVLVVDDNRDALEMMLDTLKEAGLDAIGASTSTEALELARRLHPRVAVLDIGLPEMDGFELARTLRSATTNGSLRLIALTGYGQEQDIEAARAAGFDAFFVKPVEIPALLDAMG